jgi:two-component system cell cycle response regulator DivK
MANPTVVIVDDDVDFLEELAEVLCAYGFAVKTVSNPLAAVGVIEEAQPVAVLLDLKMDAKNGFEIARELSEKPETVGIPVIAMTAHYTEGQTEKLRNSGVVKSFLIKPLSIPDVIAVLEGMRAAR